MYNTKNILHFMTCGSVDNGKSTLMGRLLYESNAIYKDQVVSIQNESKKSADFKKSIDYSLFLDGLSAEQEQRITIDVAYRYFSTAIRKFIIADAPGHLEYTRNMVTAASQSNLAVVVVGANQGALAQTLRHLKIIHFFGIKHVCLVINKMDLISYSEKEFNSTKNIFLENIKHLRFSSVEVIPVSALMGDNVTAISNNMNWYTGGTFLNYLETVKIIDHVGSETIFPIQLINVYGNERLYSGTLNSGTLTASDYIYNIQSKQKSKINKIFVGNELKNSASAAQAISISLENHIDVSRGDVLTTDLKSVHYVSSFNAELIWLSFEYGFKNCSYNIKLATQWGVAEISNLVSKYDLNKEALINLEKIELNEIVKVEVKLNKPLAMQTSKVSSTLGTFLLVDKVSNATLAVGTIHDTNNGEINFSNNINKVVNNKINKQNKIIWLTGLSGSGKSTIAAELKVKLTELNINSYVLDADLLRTSLNKDLGFTNADRTENIRRIAEIAKIMSDVGLIVIVAAISPFKKDREMAKNIVGADKFNEVYVSTPIEICEKRDVKGLYKKARLGLIQNFTGIDGPYEKPLSANIEINTAELLLSSAVEKILSKLFK